MAIATRWTSHERCHAFWVLMTDETEFSHPSVRTKFIFGADGGRSRVARDTDAKFTSQPSGGIACNILFQADVGHLMEGRHAQIHTISMFTHHHHPHHNLINATREKPQLTFRQSILTSSLILVQLVSEAHPRPPPFSLPPPYWKASKPPRQAVRLAVAWRKRGTRDEQQVSGSH